MARTSDNHYEDATRTMNSREADAEEFWHRIDMHIELDADNARDEMADYPLCLEWHQGRVRLIFGTGGPHDELNWAQDEDYGEPTDLTFTYLPWFNRVELRPGPALTRWAEDLADTIELSSLPGFDEDDPHNMGELSGDDEDDEG